MFECANLNLYLQPPKTQEEVQKFMYHTPQQKDISMFQFLKNEINWVANYMKINNKAKASAVLLLLMKNASQSSTRRDVAFLHNRNSLI